MSLEPSLHHPIFFEPNRVWRVYRGGLLLDRFLGISDPADSHFPEEWLASVTHAQNAENSRHPDEGLSRLRMENLKAGPLFDDLIKKRPEACLGAGAVKDTTREAGLGVLCKFLDSAIRLPIQVHPDRAFARKHYKSEVGKTEAWLILDTRKLKEEDPYLLMGFKPGVSKPAFAEAVRKQDICALLSMLHRFPAKAGEAYLIPGRLPHAIGPGVLMLEVQEPSDWVVQPERRVGDYELSDSDMWGPLSPELGLECFDYSGAATAEEILRRTRLEPLRLPRPDGGQLERFVGLDRCDCFSIDRLTVHSQVELENDGWRIAVITSGQGRVSPGMASGSNAKADACQPESVEIGPGDTFFIPAVMKKLNLEAVDGDLQVWMIGK